MNRPLPNPRRGRSWSQDWGCSTILSCLLTLLAPATHAADGKKDKKEEKKPEPPRVVVALPLAVSAGMTNKIKIRG